MDMINLAKQYRKSASVLKKRIDSLHTELKANEKTMCSVELDRMRVRINTLEEIYRQTGEAAYTMEHYYDERYKRNGKFTI